jgi:hypothetical protein
LSKGAIRARLGAWPRILAAVVGTLPAALLTSACLARFLPLSEDARFAIGFALAIPIWIALMSAGFLARRGALAWAVLVGMSAVLAVLTRLPDR